MPGLVHGLDTGFLVVAELKEVPEYTAAQNILATIKANGDFIAIVPQVLAEFIHVATDARRFSQPLSAGTAIKTAEQWWTANGIIHVFPDEAAMRQFFTWLTQFSLGRKRLLDTLSAATFHNAGIQSVLTTNPSDFAVFGFFTCITP